MTTNLRREAERCGIEGARLIFAPRLPLSSHLGRQSAADLFLDTSPYNAGATAAIALWAAVPVVTLLGETFVGRMAASMLHAIGIPELVTQSWPDYAAMALKIATDPELCASLKAKLFRARGNSTLFNPERFTRQIEAAYTSMCDACRLGHSPADLAVTR